MEEGKITANTINEMRQKIAIFDELVSKLSLRGFKTLEESGYSDEYYYFIGVKPPPIGNLDKITWLFTANTVDDFIFKAKFLLELIPMIEELISSNKE